MPFNQNSRRPPPPPQQDDDSVPPPVPSRPHAQRHNKSAATKPPSPPEGCPPALPSRPGRSNLPPVPVEIEQDEYEDISAMPPVLVNPRHKHVLKTATLPLANSGPKVMKAKSKGIRPSESFKESGKDKHFKNSDQPSKKEPFEEKKRRVTVGVMNRPEFPDSPDDQCYEVPQQIVVSPSSKTNTGFNPHSEQQRQSQTSDFDDDVYESDDGWSDSEWAPNASDDRIEDAEEVYEFPEEDMAQDDGLYTAADPVTPDIQPDKKNFLANPTVNVADIQMKRLNLTSPSQPDPKPSPTVSDKSKTDTPSPLSLSGNVLELRKQLESRNLIRPTPPPKPVGVVKPSTIAIAPAASTIVPKDKDTKKRNSGDNASAGSASSKKGGQSDAKQKEKQPILPPGKVTSPMKKENKVETNKPSPTNPKKPERIPQPVPDEFFPDDIYDDAVSMSENLSGYDWFHGKIDRKEGDRRIISMGSVGAFLIRESRGNANADSDGNCFPYTLVVKTEIEVKNLRIRQRPDLQYAIGTTKRADEICFSQVYDLVDHHRDNYLRVFRQKGLPEEVVKLMSSPKKQ